jgi:hypothetical protein
MANFVRRLGVDEAPEVARFYLTHNKGYYIEQMHSVGAMLRDAEALRTQWSTDVQMLRSKANELERQQHSSDNWTQGARIVAARRKS